MHPHRHSITPKQRELAQKLVAAKAAVWWAYRKKLRDAEEFMELLAEGRLSCNDPNELAELDDMERQVREFTAEIGGIQSKIEGEVGHLVDFNALDPDFDILVFADLPPPPLPLRLLSGFRWFCGKEHRANVEAIIADLVKDARTMNADGHGKTFVSLALAWRSVAGGILPIVCDGFRRLKCASLIAAFLYYARWVLRKLL